MLYSTSGSTVPVCPTSLNSLAATEVAGLQQGEVGTAQDGLRLAERIDLASAGLLAHIVVLQQPVAFTVQGSDVLDGGRKLLGAASLGISVGLESLLGVSLGSLLVGDGLLVVGALGGGITHGLLVLLGRILLINLGHLHLLVEVLDQ